MAYLTTTILQNESSWWFTAWQPAIPDAPSFTTWLGTMVTRVANNVQWRVGATLYATSDVLVQGILQEAELCLATYYLLLASASLADTSDDVTTVPMVAHGLNLRADAQEYMTRHLELLAPYDLQRAGQKFACPASDGGLIFPEAVPTFNATVDWARTN